MTEMAEGARLEIVCAVKSCTEGSNPSLSAIQFGFTEILLKTPVFQKSDDCPAWFFWFLSCVIVKKLDNM